jgi:tRNA pseudouridine55 synthase
MATGLLALAVGSATRLLRFVQSETKIYSGTVRLGVATDSLDADGAVIATAEVPELNEALVAAAALRLTGPQMQVPPMVSAIKVGGRRLYEIAREGGEVVREARSITIDSFDLAPTAERDVWTFRTTCSTGTYVRVLLSDLAESLGTLGHLTALRRESSGSHSVSNAWALENLERAVIEGQNVLLPPLEMVAHLPRAVARGETLVSLRFGKQVDLDELQGADEGAVVDASGSLVAIVHRRDDRYQPDVVLA